jgi:hypothetical protein
MTLRVASIALALVALTACSPRPVSQTENTASSIAPVSVVAGDQLDCASPAGPKTTGKELVERYGKDLVFGDVGGPEGTQLMGAMLYKDDPKRRIDIVWWDDARTVVSTVRTRGEENRVTGPMGLHIGSSLAEVEAANGKPFTISGFGWDYGGFAMDYKDGTLNSLPSGCHISLRFDNVTGTGPMPEGISGDGVQVSSDDARVKQFAPVVTEISVGWPLPQGITPAEQ